MKLSKNIIRILIASVIMAVTLSTSVGYAVLSDELNIEGNNNANTQSGIFITDAKIASNVEADLTNSSVTQNGGCILSINTTLSESNINSTLSYDVTFYNSTNDYYVYYTNSSTRTNKSYITYNVSGIIKQETIIAPKSYLNCQTTYKYTVDPTTSNIISSDGIVTYTFTKCYKVTYENFSSSSGLTTYANPYRDFSVTLDDSVPVAVEVDNSDISMNNFSMSGSTLTVNSSSISGNINIRKKTKKTFTNIIKNGSFENGLNNWTINGNQSSWYPTTIAKYGSNAYYRTSSSSSYNYITQSVSWIKDNKYYYFAHGIATTNQNLYCDVTNRGGSIKVTVVPHYWKRGSVIFSPTFSGNNTISVNYAQTTDNVIVDGIGLINLTQIFGAGQEPPLSWCNLLIDIYDNSNITIYM